VAGHSESGSNFYKLKRQIYIERGFSLVVLTIYHFNDINIVFAPLYN